MAKEFNMEIMPGIDYILEEGGNTSTNLRMISWNNMPAKYDIRKWAYADGQEKAMKGITLTEQGADELAVALVECGRGNTAKLRRLIEAREDYDSKPSEDSDDCDDGDESYYDPSELFGDM